MSFIERLVEQRIADAIRRGELDPGPLKGKPIGDLDRPRAQGWWAEQFVVRERRRTAREDARQTAESWRRRIDAATNRSALRRRVAVANEWVAEANRSLHPDDAITPFDLAEIERRRRR